MEKNNRIKNTQHLFNCGMLVKTDSHIPTYTNIEHQHKQRYLLYNGYVYDIF